MSTLEEAVRRAAEEADLYEQTVQALLTFAAFVCHDGNDHRPNSHFGFGRRMHSSAENRSVPPESELNPDLVAQKSGAYGLALEAKCGMAAGDDVWASYVSQLEKYDDDLTGWWTETEEVSVSDAALLLHRSRARRFIRYLNSDEPRATDFSDGVAVIEFVRSVQINTFYSFTPEWGGLRDSELQSLLDDSVEVPLERVIRTFAQVQFYDSKPPLPMLLEVLWGEFYSRIDELDRDEARGCWLLNTTVEEITGELQKAYGSGALDRDQRSSEFPRVSWIREALRQLVRLELARGEEDGSFTIFVRSIGGKTDLRSEFVKRLRAKQPKPKDGGSVRTTPDQTTLPLDE